MTQKDYIVLAKALAEARKALYEHMSANDIDRLRAIETINHSMRVVVVKLSDTLKKDNARFNESKFYNAALTDKE